MMKLLALTKVEQRTLRDMGIHHSHARARMRAQAILRLSQGLTLQQTAEEFGVHLNSVEQWRQRWNKRGLAGLYEGHHTGRKPKWTAEQQQALRARAEADGGSAPALLRAMPADETLPSISPETAMRYLRRMAFSYKRYRYSLKKKHPVEAFGKARRIIGELKQLAHKGQCELLFFDESGFSPNPPVQSGWSPIGQTRAVEPLSHSERVNVLGALSHDQKLHWRIQRRPTVRDDVIGFFDELAAQPHTVPRIVVLDNASIHKGKPIDKRRKAWMAQLVPVLPAALQSRAEPY